MGYFRYTLSPIAGIVDRMTMEIMVFLFYFEALAYMSIVLEFITVAFNKYGKSSTSEFNADLELLLNKLFLNPALANGTV
jgi:hypothetical protein